MPVVFVIADEWMLRAGIRAELREHGVRALGFTTTQDVGRAIASGEAPSALILDANSQAASDPVVEQLTARIPTVLIASHTTTTRATSGATVLFRPVQIAEVVRTVLALLKGSPA